MTQPSPKYIRPSQHRKLLADEDRASSLRHFDSGRPPKEKEQLDSLITLIIARASQRNRNGTATNVPANQDPPPLDTVDSPGSYYSYFSLPIPICVCASRDVEAPECHALQKKGLVALNINTRIWAHLDFCMLYQYLHGMLS